MANHYSLRSLGNKLSAISKKAERNMTKIFRQTVLIADQVVVIGTPVLTGRARAGWDVTVGVESDFVPAIEYYVSSEQATAHALERGESTMAGWKSGDGTVYITNNVNYVSYLDQGSSAQAPEGMTQAAVAAATNYWQTSKVL